MPAIITTLIDKTDTFEQVRDQVAAILAVETINQVAIATTDGKPVPAEWALDIFSERTDPWSRWLHVQNPDNVDITPIVNVSWDNSGFIESSSNISERQMSDVIINIDIYGYGFAQDVAAGGHEVGDKSAALRMQRAVRYVRNILMSAQYVSLGFPKPDPLVWQRWITSMTSFQPANGDEPVQNVHATRIALRVRCNEFSPQFTPQTLEIVASTVTRQEDGFILVQADYDYT